MAPSVNGPMCTCIQDLKLVLYTGPQHGLLCRTSMWSSLSLQISKHFGGKVVSWQGDDHKVTNVYYQVSSALCDFESQSFVGLRTSFKMSDKISDKSHEISGNLMALQVLIADPTSTPWPEQVWHFSGVEGHKAVHVGWVSRPWVPCITTPCLTLPHKAPCQPTMKAVGPFHKSFMGSFM